ncbi:unnamed protein product [Amaranthus hypochondriacus]
MATVLVARQGRHRQLYIDNRRLVSGCIPYRLKEECKDCNRSLENCIQVLMITSPKRHDLVFPKGGWENDETVHEAARREAYEEAGVIGELDPTELGVWEFRSKSRQAISSLEGGCRGYMYALKVTEELDTWPEQENHDRKWLSIREAFDLCRYDWMRDALKAFLKHLKSITPQNQLQIDRDSTVNTSKGESKISVSPSIISECQVVKWNPTNHPQFGFHDPSFSKSFVTGSLKMGEITITVQIKELV